MIRTVRAGEHPNGDEKLRGQREHDRDPLHRAVVRPGDPGREDGQGHRRQPAEFHQASIPPARALLAEAQDRDVDVIWLLS